MIRKILSIVAFFCLLNAAQCVGQDLNRADAQGKITVKGHITPACTITLDQQTSYSLTFDDNTTESPAIPLASHCNDASQHKITVAYNGELTNHEQTHTIPYSLMVDGVLVQNDHKIASQGLSYNGSIKVSLKEADPVPPGDYTGTVVFTICHGA
jgi:hypothetical protein